MRFWLSEIQSIELSDRGTVHSIEALVFAEYIHQGNQAGAPFRLPEDPDLE